MAGSDTLNAEKSGGRTKLTGNHFSISSTAFAPGGHIPKRYGCEGQGVNPDLAFSGFPQTTKTIALITEDPDAPSGVFDHWVLWNILPNEVISEGSVPGTSGMNSKKQNGYTPPCPPDKQHRYFFRAYALDTKIDIPDTSGKKELQAAMAGHVLATAELMGLYKKEGQ
jgi:Raf kinase inhibitor-like YbhB/YbcL family protein